MKRLLLFMAFAGMLSAAQAHSDKKGSSKSEAKQKEHVCTKDCKDGHHVYAHGEKGHVCTDACKKKM